MARAKPKSNPALKVEWVTVTPERAREWLKTNVKNRQIKRLHMLRLMRDMKAGEWDENGETITFDSNGRLVDGQHRLEACSHGGVPFRTLVVWGVDPETRTTIDTGISRTGGDMLDLHGERHGSALAAILGYIWRHEHGTLDRASDRPTRHELLELLAKHPEATQAAALCAQRSWREIGRPSLLGFCYWAFSQKDTALADVFFDGLTGGDMLRATEPVFKLRNRLLQNKASSRKMVEREFLGLTIKAWNLTRQGKQADKNLVFRAKLEKLPAIE